MKIVPFKFPEDYDEIEIYPLNDLHIGAKETDIKLFQQFVKFIKDKPNRYIVCIGDLLNNALKNSVSDVYSETMNPNEQRKWLVTELEPIKERLLCFVSGNHEYRTKKDVDLNPVEWIAEKLGVENYSEDEMVIKLSFGKGANGKPVTYSMVLTHGAGGGKRPGSVINNLELYAMTFDNADIVVIGHCHRKIGYKLSTRVIDCQNNMVRQMERLCVVSSAWLDFGGYAARKMLIPGVKGASPIILSGKEKRMQVVI